MNLRLLLVEPEPEEALFLKDVLADIEEGRHFSTWVHIDTWHAPSWEEAEAILSSEAVDVILLNPELPDCNGFETFRRSRSIAPSVPVVLLLEPGEDALGVRILREGAQDFMIRGQVDCAPLAHALRNAMERERLVAADQAARFRDPLTGLPNMGCFAMLAERDRKLAERLGARWMVMFADLKDRDRAVELDGEQRRDWAAVQISELLLSVAKPPDLLYRLTSTRFALTVFETGFESLEQTQRRVEKALVEERVKTGSAIFSPENPVTLEDLVGDANDAMVPVRRMRQTAGVA
jgi:PleD family two-component response regulator